jgi:hypothetical protein
MGKNYIHRGTYIAVLILTFAGFSVFAQVGIGTTNPNENALLDIDASTRAGGLLLPRVALVSANSPAPLVNPVPAGMTVYNIATSGTGANEVTPGFYYHNGTNWVRIGAAGDDGPNDKWKLTGNTGTSPGTNFIGTLDNVAFQVRTNNSARFDFTNNGRLRSFNDGDAAQPTYSWNGANGQNMGMFRAGANGIGFSTNNVERLRIAQGNQVHAMHNGTAALPFYSWGTPNNNTTGFFLPALRTLGFSTNGSERMRIMDNGQIAVNRTTPISPTTRLTVAETGMNRAIYGNSGSGEGVRGEVANGNGVVGLASSSGGNGGGFHGAHSQANGLIATGGSSSIITFPNSGTGAAISGRLYGLTSMSTSFNGLGIVGIGDNIGGIPQRPLGIGVLGYGYQTGVFGDSGYFSQIGVYGVAEGDAVFGGAGVYGENLGGLGEGAFGNSSNVGVRGYGAHGAILESSLSEGFGAVAWNIATTGADRVGLLAIGQNSTLMGFPGAGAILIGNLHGGAGFGKSATSTGLVGAGNNITQVSLAPNGSGVAGTGTRMGVFGKATQGSNGMGLAGIGNNLSTITTPNEGAGIAGAGFNIGVFGHATNSTGFGIYSSGNMHAIGNFTSTGNISSPTGILNIADASIVNNVNVGATLTAHTVLATDLTASGVKNFIIDDPRDPANKFLKHASIESNEILNLYRGVATFDGSGQVIVHLPDYYEAINKNESYQLTPIGAAMPNLYIAEKVNMGTFVIAGGVPGKEVSWTITAERNDPYIRNNPHTRNMVVDKGAERGLYLAPEAYGQQPDKGIQNYRLAQSTPISNNISVTTQEMPIVTEDAKILDAEEVQQLTTSFKPRPENTGLKKPRNHALTKAEITNIDNKPVSQEGQVLANPENNSEIIQAAE